MQKVLYDELVPQEFRERLAACPVAYLSMGSIEWHGEQNPYGTDAIIAHGINVRLAKKVGGIVFPPMHMGPDSISVFHGSNPYVNENESLYGMDHWTGEKTAGKKIKEPSRLEGSCYWMPDEFFMIYIESIFKQLKRAGFKAVVGNGHGPSVVCVMKRADDFFNRYGLKFFDCWSLGDEYYEKIKALGPGGGHGGIQETAMNMVFRPELVQIGRLPSVESEPDYIPIGIDGPDVRVYATKEYGEAVVDLTVQAMEKILVDYMTNTYSSYRR